MNNQSRTALALWAMVGIFALLGASFLRDAWGHTAPLQKIPLVDRSFLDQATWRTSYADLVRTKQDLSDFDCLGCHDKGSPPKLKYDAHSQILIPDAHSDIKMGHGEQGRNNNCYNCHNEANLATLSARNGRELTFAQSTQLCGSCHGPILEDWEAGVHGRANGYWNHALGPEVKKDCVNCHNPHAPRFPGRQPAPGPHSLHSPIYPAEPHSAKATD
ncbi:MAG: hypothetical protein ACHQ4G_02165 [Opitutales bacterium]